MIIIIIIIKIIILIIIRLVVHTYPPFWVFKVQRKKGRKKTDTTKLVFENLKHNKSFEKRFECCGTKTYDKVVESSRCVAQLKKKTCLPMSVETWVQ